MTALDHDFPRLPTKAVQRPARTYRVVSDGEEIDRVALRDMPPFAMHAQVMVSLAAKHGARLTAFEVETAAGERDVRIVL